MYNKFKDALPEDTIMHIRKIHQKLNLLLECQVVEKVNGVFSATLSDKINGWNTCGKGTTSAYCQASAYGESIEHLCSYFAYDTLSLPNEAHEYLGFLRYPDEQKVAIEDIPLLSPDVYQDMVDAYCRTGNSIPSQSKIIEVWKRFLGHSSTTVVPYYSVRQKKIVYLPDVIIANLCGSNGGGAGNTPAEAIGHALDEISERYAKFQIYKRRLTPPTIDREYIKNICIDLYELILEIEKKTNFKIVVKDASLGKGLSVVSVLLIDQQNQRYLANFGAHPRFEIALERCLTELFQLYDPEKKGMKRKEMARWRSLNDDEIDGIRNWISLLRDDTGVIPDTFFAGSSFWDFSPWKQYINYDNKLGIIEQLNNLRNITDADIYIRNISFLGFPVYRVYIPGVSTTYLSLDEQQLNAFNLGNELVSKIKQNNEQIPLKKDLIQLRDLVFNPDSFVCALIFRNMSEAMLNAFRAALYYDLGDRETAMLILDNQDDRFCHCAVRDFELADKNFTIEKRKELFLLFYGQDEYEFVSCWQKENVFMNLLNKYVIKKQLNLHGNTSKDIYKTSLLHKRLKKFMKDNIPNQSEISLMIE